MTSAGGRLTAARLAVELRRLLARPDTKIRLRRLGHCGQSTWVPETMRDITITLDPRRDGRVPLVIHELLHIYLAASLKPFSARLEEAAVMAWEWEVWCYVSRKNTKRLEQWDRAIQRKLGGARAAR